mgnify:CR=1 FL=1
MAIFREVRTKVYCDICGEQIVAFLSADRSGGVSREWAAYFARQEGCTTGKKIICKSCRISRRIEKCSLQKKIGVAGRDGNGACMGFGKEFDDEPIEQCKRCIACTSFDWEEEKQRLSIEGRKRKRGRE